MQTFEEILKQYDITVKETGHEHCRPGWLQVDCPWCSPNWGHYRLGIHKSTGAVNCWACGRHKLFETFQELTGLEFGAVSRLLRDVIKEDPVPRKERTGNLTVPKGLSPIGDSFLDPHWRYLKKRGYSPRKLEKLWEIKAIRLHHKLPWRIFIPIFYRGNMVSWTTRSIVDSGQRYISASAEEEAVDHKTLLYGEDYARHSVVVVEGPTGVWRVGPGSVCTFGTAFSMAQVEKISKYPVRVICFDPETTAQKKAEELCDLLEAFPGETYNVVLEGGDPGDAPIEEIVELRNRFLD